MFIFYDTETTGIDAAFDQILQFAAILTDEKLFEIERFEIRCQLLPWVVPSPTAMLVTRTPVSILTDKTLPTFFGMMATIYEKLSAWSPATFIGYNSLKFDEQFLHRALWQTLHPPYITVTNYNKRCDLLPMMRVASHYFPDSFVWPKSGDGKNTLKLDQLAPSNGFNHINAHDALNDVEATIFLAKKLSAQLPDLWSALIKRSSRTDAASVALSGEPVLLFESFKGKSAAWFGQKVECGRSGAPSQASIAKLGYDWRGISDVDMATKGADVQKNTRLIALNKAPTVFTLEEAKQLFGLEPTNMEMLQSDFLNNSEVARNEIATAIITHEQVWRASAEIEQQIYQGFPSKKDERLATSFRNSNPLERHKISYQFTEQKYRELALRLLYLNHRETLTDEEISKIRSLIVNRLIPSINLERCWRSISDAVKELSDQKALELGSKEEINSLKQWYLSLSNSLIDTEAYKSS